ncbi:MAG: homoserine dehydrogenase [Anaerolineaceae bacterium]|nr:homoserine dehydrogenase [Anaerolineaceae bacterium]
MHMKNYSICMIGFGNVGQAFARLLSRKANQVSQEYNASFKVTAIATKSHGSAINHAGIDMEKALNIAAKKGLLNQLSDEPTPEDIKKFIKNSKADFLLENSPVNYESGEPAITHIQAALENDMHAVSANKGPVVHAYKHLSNLAKLHQKRFLFESAVMDGAPIFSVFREALPEANIQGFEGILNSCTNILIEKMEQGSSFDEAVAFAQSIGIAETDPSGDIDGWDAAIKIAALATVLMNAPLKPQDVQREGIRGLTRAAILEAKKEGMRWKLVCSAERIHGKLVAKVAPQRIPPTSPLYSVSGTSSFILFKTDVLPGFGILESNPSPDTTAYGLLADILNILK